MKSSAFMLYGTLQWEGTKPNGTAMTKRVLLAEDNAPLLRVTEFNLEAAGYRVSCASNGREAWDLVQREPFDLVVTDQQMPEMSGWDLCTRMRATEIHARTPVIFLTAKGLELDRERLSRELGVAKVFGKPFSPRDLVAAIDEILLGDSTVAEVGRET